MIIALVLLSFGLLNLPDGVRCGSHHETTLYVDTLLRVVLPTQLQDGSLDPYTMPDFESRAQSDHRITVKGKFRNGRMTGLSNLRRIGQCGPPVTAPQGNITFNCTIGLDKLNVSYRTGIKYGILPYSNSIVTANLTRAFGVIEITSNQRGNSPSLTRFTLATLGQFDWAIVGGVLRREFVHLRSEFSNSVINYVNQVLNGAFTTALSTAVSRSPLPIGLVN